MDGQLQELHARDSGLGLESASELVDHCGLRLDTLEPKGSLEIGDHACPEGRVLLGAPDEIVDLAAGQGKLLRSAHPALRGWRQSPQQLGKPDLVIPGHSH
jgi:hypothetical protein